MLSWISFLYLSDEVDLLKVPSLFIWQLTPLLVVKLYGELPSIPVKNAPSFLTWNKGVSSLFFINTEFVSENTLLGSAYDADSEGVEGKYYVWSYEELKKILENDFTLFEKKYEISKSGNFEGKNILVESKNELKEEEQNKIAKIEDKLIKERKNIASNGFLNITILINAKADNIKNLVLNLRPFSLINWVRILFLSFLIFPGTSSLYVLASVPRLGEYENTCK